MAPSLPLSSLLLLLLALGSANGDQQLISTTCAKTSFVDFCMSTLLSNPSGPAAADAKGLAAVVVETGISNATDTAKFVVDLSQNSTGLAKDILIRTCNSSYATAAVSHSTALSLLNGGDIEAAAAWLHEAYGYPYACLSEFTEFDVPYPPALARRETCLERLDVVAMNITAQIGH